MRINRRQLLVSSLAFATAAQARDANVRGAKEARPKGQLSLNLNGLAYWIGFCPFLNWAKMAGDIGIGLRRGGRTSGKAVFDAGYVDRDTGELVNPVPVEVASITRLFFSRSAVAGHDFSGERWIIKW